MAMTGKERAALRAHAHHLSASVHVGQHGLTRALVHSLDDALRTHELVKVQLVKNADVTAKQAAGELTGLTGVDDPYEAPDSPDLRIESQHQTVQESAAAVHALLTERGLA